MKAGALLCAVLLTVGAGTLHADDPAPKAKAAAEKGKSAQAMDPKAMEEMMMKMAAPGPQHERFKQLEGEWDLVVTSSWDPTQAPQESKGTSVVRTLMEGRYSQEDVNGVTMGRPFTGMGITGYDNIQKKYVSTWIDNMGTGIMTSSGTADASGKVINWTGESSDPMTGKVAKYRMVTRFTDSDNYTFEMFGKMNGKEMKMMQIQYSRKKA
jgi:Protein of unknown function (DUF1579)